MSGNKTKEKLLILNTKGKISFKWITTAIGIIMWALLEEVVLSSSDLVTNFFANKIDHGTNESLNHFVNYANNMINGWKDYHNHFYNVGEIETNAIAAEMQIYNVIMSVLFGFAYGIGVYTAQYFGNRQYQKLRDLTVFKILVGLCISLIFVLLSEIFSKNLMEFIINPKYVAEPDISASHEEWITYFDSQASIYSANEASKFLSIVVISYPILAINLAFITVLRETGRPMVSFWASFIAFILTVFFLVFLVEPSYFGISSIRGFGIIGCAISIIIGKITQLFFILIFIFIKKYEFIPNRIFSINKTIWVTPFKKSLMIAFNEFLWSLSILMQVKLLSMYSLETLTANAIFTTIASIIIYPTYHGLSAGVAVMIGNNLGDNKLEIAYINSKRLIWITLILGIIMSFLIFGMSFLFGYVFTNISKEIYELTKQFFIVYSFSLTALMLNGSFYSIIRSGGKVYTVFIMDSLYNWVITIPIMTLMILDTSLNILIIYSLVRVCEVLKIIPSLYFYYRKKWLVNLIYKEK